jgi:dipeptidyl-peptidase-4
VEPTVSFPRLSARTLRFTLGEPRTVSVTADGRHVLFVRTGGGTDRTGMLWSFDTDRAGERLLADPRELLDGSVEDLTPEERARRERAREAGAGIVGYSLDDRGATAVFALSGRVWACDVDDGRCWELPTVGSAVDPRIDPTGRRIAYATGDSLRVVELDASADRVLAEPGTGGTGGAGDAGGPGTVVWGRAEFVAAEEMDRHRGYWWAPDGESLLVQCYDEAPVGIWYVADPAHPDRQPAAQRYPAAGTANVVTGLWHIGLDGGRRVISWQAGEFPYLTRVSWTAGGAVFQVMSRDQTRARIHRFDPVSGTVTMLAEQRDEVWIDLVPGLPALAPDGRLLNAADTPETTSLVLNGEPISPPGTQLVAVLDVGETAVLATVSTEATTAQLVRIGYDGSCETLSPVDGVYGGAAGGGTVAVVGTDLEAVAGTARVWVHGTEVARLRSAAIDPGFVPRVTLLTVGDRELRAAVLFPRDHAPGSERLPVLMAPYGGPHGQQVRRSLRLFLSAQWLADQGFAVVVADGRGTPRRGPAWDRAVRDDLAAVTLADQVEALAGVAARYPDDLDTSRVGILGWSYGGYLSALAVLDRPDVFHAAVAGAPVTDWRLYDTFYTERYLGDPRVAPEVYDRNSLIGRAPRLTRPLLLIHGLVDDNVVVAHTLRLSAALLAAGREHRVLPLSGVTHMAQQEDVAENLLLAQVAFFREALPAG